MLIVEKTVENVENSKRPETKGFLGFFKARGGEIFGRRRGGFPPETGDDLWENGCPPIGPTGTVGFSPFREGGPPRSRCTPEGVPFCDQKGTEKVPPVSRRWTRDQG